MPKRKHDSDEEESAVESNAGSSGDEKPKKSAKKAKTTKAKASTSEGKKKASSSLSETKEIEGIKYTVDGDEKWITVGTKGTRRVTIREFKGKTYVDIREFYVDKQTSESKPGKKGISLTVEEWHDLLRVKDAITALAGGAEET
ncbi:hypothetical protein PIIN_01413 [Serendipita indica DSM 11827]|uniref:Transcriptional coactivator p15 (PC4) C-terminal domain-containing protein n=1 Tax=Serendipita indica (strain DSM 11827) TaxID=1109443 RepID=G4T8F4_SERID|nr:hypothetical protein PIIN_01413 [Serendipita indica DSM 11827]